MTYDEMQEYLNTPFSKEAQEFGDRFLMSARRVFAKVESKEETITDLK